MQINLKQVSIALTGLALSAIGSGLAVFSMIGLLGLPLAVAGAFVAGGFALSLRNSQVEAARSKKGRIFIVIGTVLLFIGSFGTAADPAGHIMTQPIPSIGHRIPDSPSLLSWRPGIGLLTLWLAAPYILLLGVRLRGNYSTDELLLLFLYWLAYFQIGRASCRERV